METIENNKLIAEFMGMELGDDKTMYFDDAENLHPPMPFDQLKFHTSWDWLAPVISKCRDESDIEDSPVYPADREYHFLLPFWEAIYYSLEGCDRNETYKFLPYKNETYEAVVEFIKGYNKQK